MSPEPLEHVRVETSDGARLAVQRGGDRDLPALLLLAGQANSHRWWTDLRGGLERDFHTVSFDYRGTGDTEAEMGDWSTASFAHDAAVVLEALGLSSAHVYGTSMGGRVAQLLAIEHPERVDRLVLCCTSPGGPHAGERDLEVRRALSQPDEPARVRALLDLMYTPAWATQGRRSHLLGDPSMSTAQRRQHLRVSGRHDAWDRLPLVQAPTLVLHGEDDRMSPAANADLIGARIPGAVVEVTPGARHGFFDELRDEVTPRVARFLLGGS